MPSLYFREDCKRWRVQSRRSASKYISIHFDDYEEAKAYYDEVAAIEKANGERKKHESKAKKLDMLKSM